MKNNYRLTLPVVFLAFLFSCNNATQTNVENPNKKAAARLYDAFNSHHWSAYADCYSADADFLDPSYGKDYVKQTHQQIVDKYTGLQKMSPDIKDDVIAMYETGEKIIVEFVAVGTAPDGTKWKLPICSVLTFQNGKIIRDATYFDNEE